MTPQRGTRTAALAAVALTVLASAACASGPSEAGLGLPTVDLLGPLPGSGIQLVGTVTVAENGCFHLSTDGGTYFVIWPEGFKQDSDRVFLDSGPEFSDGDAAVGLARILDASAAVAAGDGPDGYMEAVTDFCAEEEELAVFSEIAVG
jgi:ABC-type sugar transport system substrate-binding protein